MNVTGRKIEALANEAILNGIELFEEKFPNATDEEFTFFYTCLHTQTGFELYRWGREDFQETLDK